MSIYWTTTNDYLVGTSATNIDSSCGWIQLDGTAIYNSTISGFSLDVKSDNKGIHPILYFKYIKKKFKPLERMKMDGRLKRLEKAFYKAVDNGQDALGEKLLKQLAIETRETAMFAKGIKLFIEKTDLDKHKHNIRDGHISDTMLKDFTRVIPKNVAEKKKKVEDCFDDFVIYHYWNEKEAEKIIKGQKMDAKEEAKMKDPVLFGIIKETNKLYFIADWDDEFCNLSFEELADAIGKDDEEITIQREPKL
jgi:hypothetical protein